MKTLEPAGSDKVIARSVHQTLDVENLDAAQPAAAIREFEVKGKPKSINCDLLIVGGGMGAVAAAMAACSSGINVCLTEQTSWLGGQMTSQGVSALDENYMVESSGATRRYKAFRQSVRDYYKSLGGVEGQARFEEHLDPGNCWVSRLAFEPKVAVKLLSEMLRPYLESGKLKIFVRTEAFKVRKSGGRVKAVQCVDIDTGKTIEFRCRFCIDATELGDMLPLCGVDYRSGAESRNETGEAHAPENANPENVQDFTYPFVVEFCPGENHTIDKPPHYDEFHENGKFSLLGYRMFENSKTVNADGLQSEYMPFWEYRRLIAQSNFPAAVYPHDIAMINWESNDLRGENIIDKTPAIAAERLALGKFLSMGFLYWMQTEMRRDDGGKGYPELKLRSDILGTSDGVSKYPYIRESRRIKARYTIVESDVTRAANSTCRAKLFCDSLGIGLYPVDIHGKQDVPGAGQLTRPFQIPASAMVQNQLRNLLPACKNIGSTHVTNGAYRLHPIEWAIGEAAGTYAAEALMRKTDIVRLLKNKRALRSVQDRLLANGAPLFWFDDVSPEHAAFAAIQYVSVSALMQADQRVLSFRPDQPVTRLEMAQAIARLLRLSVVDDTAVSILDLAAGDPEYAAVAACLAHGLVKMSDETKFEPERLLSADELKVMAKHKLLRSEKNLPQSNPVTRSDFASWLYGVCRQPRFSGR